jgi:hypothetical protein
MADTSTSKEVYDAAVTNMRDTVKWLIGSIGAVFVTVLAGVQFNDVAFATDRTAVGAAVVAAAGVMIAFMCAIATLVGGSVAFHDLATARRFKGTRRFINRIWGGSKESGRVEAFVAALAAMDRKVRDKQLLSTDDQYVASNARADELICIARWHVVRWRFGLLVVAMIVLIPLELIATGIMFSRPKADSHHGMITISLPGAD